MTNPFPARSQTTQEQEVRRARPDLLDGQRELRSRVKDLFMALLFCKALFGLLAFDVLGLGRNFRRLHHMVKTWPVATNHTSPGLIDRTCEAVNAACAWYPKQALCLQRATITTCLLRHCGVPAEMILGAQQLPLKAHAWVEVEGRAVNERSDVQRLYAVWERC